MDTGDIIIGGIVLLLIVGGLVFFGSLFFMGFGFPNSGTHTGYVTAVEKDGLFQTNSAYFKTNTQSSQEDKYCVKPDLVDELRKDQEQNKQITIMYARGFTMPVWECMSDTTTEIVGIQ